MPFAAVAICWEGVSAPGGEVSARGCLPKGAVCLRGCLLSRVCLPVGCIPACTEADTPLPSGQNS